MNRRKIEANVNLYTFVWGKAIKTNTEKIKNNWKALGNIHKNSYSEMDDTDPLSFDAISADKVTVAI